MKLVIVLLVLIILALQVKQLFRENYVVEDPFGDPTTLLSTYAASISTPVGDYWLTIYFYGASKDHYGALTGYLSVFQNGKEIIGQTFFYNKEAINNTYEISWLNSSPQFPWVTTSHLPVCRIESYSKGVVNINIPGHGVTTFTRQCSDFAKIFGCT